MNINGYTLVGELQNANSGNSKWGFATKRGKEYFIKELLTPVFPLDSSAMSESMLFQSRAVCISYENKFKNYYEKLNNASHGNVVRIVEFFRSGSRYYVITEKVADSSVNISYISTLDTAKKCLLIKSVAYGYNDLHSVGIVHFDVKPSNIFIKRTQGDNYIGKIIDFDSGFMIGEELDCEELGGDQTYLAPETFLAICGEESIPNEKADIFALGLVFHEYWCGELPYYDTEEYACPYEAVLDGAGLKLHSSLPEIISKLIASMLDVDPKKRPSAREILTILDEGKIIPPAPKVSQLSVSYGGAYAHNVSVYPDRIMFKNEIHSSVMAETVDFPSAYSEQNSKTLTDEQFTKIVDDVLAAGLLAIVEPRSGRPLYSDRVYQTLTITYDNGKVLEYVANENADVRFDKICSILAEYCEFMQIDEAWYENVRNSASVAEKADYQPQITPYAGATASPSGDWFKPAGDL